MVFRTILPVTKSSWEITHEDFILSIGSCFADCLSEKLAQNEFNILGNPYGIIYNPLCIIANLISTLSNSPLAENLFIENSSFYHYNYHSEMNGESKEDLKTKIKNANDKTRLALQSVNYVIITLGTAFVYFLKEGQIPVANCHKMPSEKFTKRMLSVEEIVGSFQTFIKHLESVNIKARIILTVSPVRHIKDTLELNAVSKSVLKLASWQLTQKFPDKIAYFPSYEIMMDDLRDYRFYKEDLIHPTIQAENYIWEQFSETFYSKNTIELNKEIAALSAAVSHKPFHPQSEEYRTFLLNTRKKIENLNDKVAVKGLLEKVALKLGL